MLEYCPPQTLGVLHNWQKLTQCKKNKTKCRAKTCTSEHRLSFLDQHSTPQAFNIGVHLSSAKHWVQQRGCRVSRRDCRGKIVIGEMNGGLSYDSGGRQLKKRESAPSCFKLETWQHFGCSKWKDDRGENIPDEKKVLKYWAKQRPERWIMGSLHWFNIETFTVAW